MERARGLGLGLHQLHGYFNHRLLALLGGLNKTALGPRPFQLKDRAASN